MTKSNLLTEALNDAKALRETAIENAKLQLNEAFVPRIQAMLGQKLREETAPTEDENTDIVTDADAETDEVTPAEEVPAPALPPIDGETDTAPDSPESTEEVPETEGVPEDAIQGDETPDAQVTEEPTVGELARRLDDLFSKVDAIADAVGADITGEPETDAAISPDDSDADAGVPDEAVPADGTDTSVDSLGDDEEIDLSEVLSELGGETPGLMESNMASGESPKAKCTKETQEEVVKKTTASAKEDADHFSKKTFKESMGNPSKSGDESLGDPSEDLDVALAMVDEDVPEDGEIGEVRVSSDGTDACDPTTDDELASLQEELKDYRKAVVVLKSKLNEVNLLNAKLLYTNRIFKDFSLTNSQKMKIVESFDLSKDVREVKMAYAILKESLTINAKPIEQPPATKKPVSVARKAIVEGFASKAIGSTKPLNEAKTAVLPVEENALATRLQKLAGIK